ncbi:MAG: TatD family hydrolase [Candidatus Micrarchaeota archaeon]|nr:TatD family hydrolase [Candidatus Micrarchaeota archaeon]
MNQSLQELRTGYSVDASLIDAHCHLDLFPDPDSVVSMAVSNGIEAMITAGGNGRSNMAALRIARHDRVFATIGIDPQAAGEESGMIDNLEEEMLTSRKIVGIGEIGLDAKVLDKVPIEVQREVFERQLEIAKVHDMPVVIHSRGMLDDVVAILEERRVKKAMFHFFEGDERQATELAKKGYLISIPPAESSKRKRVIKDLDLSSMVFETDSPVVGKDPTDVAKVVRLVADLKGFSFEEVALRAAQNVKGFFYI